MSQPLDSTTGDRNLKAEADEIKQAKQAKKRDELPLQAQKRIEIPFTPLAVSVIPGNFLRKRLGLNMIVEYIPDFYYVLEVCQLILTSAKNHKSLKKVTTVNIHSFTLYMAHTLMYAYLQVVNEVNPPAANLQTVLNIYSRAGFDTNLVPAICSHWLDGLGQFSDPHTKKIFLPRLPTIEAGAISDGGFFSANTGHLLPNTFCLAAITRIAADQSTGMRILAAAATQNRNGIFGLAQAGNLQNSNLARRNAMRVPGCKALGVMTDDTELVQIVNETLDQVFTDPVQNILKISPKLLAHLKRSQEELFLEIETISISHLSTTGTALCTLPLVFCEPMAEVTPAANIAAAVGPPPVGAMAFVSEHDHNSRISSKIEIINGHVDYAYQTPLVRICNELDHLVIPNVVIEDPQPAWYLTDLEFDTLPATLLETRAYFRRI